MAFCVSTACKVVVTLGVLGVIGAIIAIIVVFTSGKTGNVKVTVNSQCDGSAIPDASVTIGGTSGSTNSNGEFVGDASVGSQKMTVTAKTGSSDPSTFRTHQSTIDVKSEDKNDATVVHVTLDGYSELAPWGTIKEAIDNLSDGPQTATVTWSMVPSGVVVSESGNVSVAVRDYSPDGSVSHAQFVAEMTEAFAQWKAAFEEVYPTLTLNFVQTTETDPAPLLGTYVPRTAGMGDIRITMFSFGTESHVLAYTYGPQLEPFNEAGDIVFNSVVDWRLDNDLADAGTGLGTSVLYIGAHEVGHALGCGHNACSDSVLAPTAGVHRSLGTLYPNGIKSSKFETAAIRGIYG